MTKRQAVRAQLILERRAEGAALDTRGARRAIDFKHAIEPAQIDRDGAAIVAAAGRFDAAGHARAAAIRRRGNARRVAPRQEIDDVAFVARISDKIEWIGIVAPKRPHDVAIAAAVAVFGAGVRLDRTKRRERIGRLDARRAQLEFGGGWRGRNLQFREAEALGHPLGHLLLLFGIGALILVAPAVKLALAFRHAINSSGRTVMKPILLRRGGRRQAGRTRIELRADLMT